MIYSWGKRLKKDIYLGKFTCPRCGNVSDFYLARLQNYAGVYFIPIINVTAERYLICEFCNGAFALSKEQYNDIKQSNSVDILKIASIHALPEQDDIPKQPIAPKNLEKPKTKISFKIITEGQSTRELTKEIEKELVIGRGNTADIIINDNNISREHFKIEKNNGYFYVSDLNSRNGTTVNGVWLSIKTKIISGDIVRAGTSAVIITILDR